MTAQATPTRHFPLGGSAEVRVYTQAYRGKQYVHIRLFYQTVDGEWRPTRKGVCVSPEQAREIGEALLAEANLGASEGL